MDRFAALQVARAEFLEAERNAVGRLMAAEFNAVRERAYRKWLEAVRAFRAQSPLTDPGVEVQGG